MPAPRPIPKKRPNWKNFSSSASSWLESNSPYSENGPEMISSSPLPYSCFFFPAPPSWASACGEAVAAPRETDAVAAMRSETSLEIEMHPRLNEGVADGLEHEGPGHVAGARPEFEQKPQAVDARDEKLRAESPEHL